MEIAKSRHHLNWSLPLPHRNTPYANRALPEALAIVLVKKIPIWKRCMDLCGSICGLILLFPMFLVIGLFIKVVSPGPVFFKQERIGKGGRPFQCLKFRTMKCDADITLHKEHLARLIGSCRTNGNAGDPMEKLENDPRIIKFGKFLRASGMDELPQLINVLMGQMSLIGPRPPIPYEVAHYPQWYMNRFDVTPGLTGLWQISGKNRLGFNQMIRLDIQYAMHRSFLLDLKILLLTPYAIYVQVKNLVQKRHINPLHNGVKP
jgi:lipopolysaccharide/colanic/teichoic acid biosynthesis glycosyltransferase